jgi:hypothetical protein
MRQLSRLAVLANPSTRTTESPLRVLLGDAAVTDLPWWLERALEVLALVLVGVPYVLWDLFRRK